MAEHTQSPGPRHMDSEGTSGQPAAKSCRAGPDTSVGDAAAQDAGVTRPSTVKPEVRHNKKFTTLRLDHDVLEWFRGQGPGYQTRMNNVLRGYAERVRSDAGKKQP